MYEIWTPDKDKEKMDALASKAKTTDTTPSTPSIEELLAKYYTGENGKKSEEHLAKANLPFNYDVYGSALYNQYKDQYTKQAKLASADAMGRASALTGGYANSYAQSVANQAYNARMDDLNDVAMQLYQMAYNQYQDARSANLQMADYYAGLDEQDYANAVELITAMYSNTAGGIETPGIVYSITDYDKIPQSVRDTLGALTTNDKLQSQIDAYVASGLLSPQIGASLYSELFAPNEDLSSYKGMLNNMNKWGYTYDGGTNWLWGIDENAVVKTPTGEEIEAKVLKNRLIENGMSKNAADDAVKKLLEHLGIND